LSFQNFTGVTQSRESESTYWCWYVDVYYISGQKLGIGRSNDELDGKLSELPTFRIQCLSLRSTEEDDQAPFLARWQ